MTSDFPPGFNKKQIAIDFDGVIHRYSKGYLDGTIYDKPIEGSLDAIKELSKKYKIIIFTCKAKPTRQLINGKTGIELVREWCEKYDIMKYIDRITSDKPRALVYIDDRGYYFKSWEKTLKDMNERL
jgi:histidinol phosphatase-like enzyme